MQNILRQSFLCLVNEDSNSVLKEEKRKIKSMPYSSAAFGLSRHLSCFLLLFSFFSFSVATVNNIFLDGVKQKKERRRLVANPLFAFFVLVSFLFVPFSFPICL